MINSMLIANELIASLPEKETPQATEGYEGFYHLNSMNGDVEETVLNYIIRDFYIDSFENRKKNMKEVVEELNKKYSNRISIEIKDQYRNMKEKIEPVMYVVDNAIKAMELVGVKALVKPIRGGTDGARLSFMGLPTPNIFAGGLNFHGKFEYIPVASMEKAVEVILKLVDLYANENK
jgi:tripeptide aminopeptidase